MTRPNHNLSTSEIDHDDWEKCLFTIGECLLGEPVRVWVDSQELGCQPVAEALPLLGLSLLRKGTDGDAIEVSLGEQLTHVIHHPEHVYVQEDEDGRTLCLWIDGRDQTNTLVCFNQAVEPAPGQRRLQVVARRNQTL